MFRPTAQGNESPGSGAKRKCGRRPKRCGNFGSGQRSALWSEFLPGGHAVSIEVGSQGRIFAGRAKVPEIIAPGRGVVVGVGIVQVGIPTAVYAGVAGGRLQFGRGHTLDAGKSAFSNPNGLARSLNIPEAEQDNAVLVVEPDQPANVPMLHPVGSIDRYSPY